MYWYVLFVMTGTERKIEHLLGKTLNPNIYKPFIPAEETIFKNSGIIKKELKPLFPGYMFIETEVTDQEFIKEIKTSCSITNKIIRILKYSNNEVAMRKREMNMLLSLYNDDYCIESSIGVIEGDRIIISEGPLKGHESIIKKVNRHKRQAIIELDFMGDKRFINVPVEIVSKM